MNKHTKFVILARCAIPTFALAGLLLTSCEKETQRTPQENEQLFRRFDMALSSLQKPTTKSESDTIYINDSLTYVKNQMTQPQK